KVLQVVSAVAGSATTNNSTTYASSNLSAAITPTSTGSKILIAASRVFTYPNWFGTGMNEVSNLWGVNTRLVRDSTALISYQPAVSDRHYTTWFGAAGQLEGERGAEATVSHLFLDAPATTSEVVYAMEHART